MLYINKTVFPFLIGKVLTEDDMHGYGHLNAIEFPFLIGKVLAITKMSMSPKGKKFPFLIGKVLTVSSKISKRVELTVSIPYR